MPTQIGETGYATHFGVPSATVSWVGRSGTQTITGLLFTSFEIAAGGDTNVTRDNSNEIRNITTTNDTLQFSLGIKPIASTQAGALAKAGDLPKKNTILTTTGGDLQTGATGTIIIDEARTSYTPDGDAMVNLTVTKHIGKTFAVQS